MERIIVHCEFGQSRSAGVMAAIQEHFEKTKSPLFESKRHRPNMLCYKYVMEALETERKRGRISRALKFKG